MAWSALAIMQINIFYTFRSCVHILGVFGAKTKGQIRLTFSSHSSLHLPIAIIVALRILRRFLMQPRKYDNFYSFYGKHFRALFSSIPADNYPRRINYTEYSSSSISSIIIFQVNTIMLSTKIENIYPLNGMMKTVKILRGGKRKQTKEKHLKKMNK